MMVNTITMPIFASYLLGMNENQTSISKSHTNNTPFVVIKRKNEGKETIKEKTKILHPTSKN
jgi:prephenate dehydratase